MLTGFQLCIGANTKSAIVESHRFSVMGKCHHVEMSIDDIQLNLDMKIIETATEENDLYYYDENCFVLTFGDIYRSHSTQIISASEIFDDYVAQRENAFGLWSGNGVVIIVIEKTLKVISPKTPGYTVYVRHCSENSISISSEIKGLAGGCLRLLERMDENTISSAYSLGKTIFDGVESILPGHYLDLSLDDIEHSWRQIMYYSPICDEVTTDPEAAIEILDMALQLSIQRVKSNKLVAFVSGGLDSGIVTALSKDSQPNTSIDTYTIGTIHENEFSHAKRLSEFLHSNHEEIIVSSDDFIGILPYIINVIEYPHSRFIEYLAPGYLAHKVSGVKSTIEISGYGSDILFAGLIDVNCTSENVAQHIRQEYETSLWANEASHVLGFTSGVSIHYPFFSPEVVSAAFRISSNLKVHDQWEKWILRKVGEMYLPNEIAWRRKVGIHESTGMESILSGYLDHDINDNISRCIKDAFCYHILKQTIVESREPKDVDLAEARKYALNLKW